MNTAIQELLRHMVKTGASDLHLKVGRPPLFRMRSLLEEVPEYSEPLTADDTLELFGSMMKKKQEREFRVRKSTDFSFMLDEGSRFRVNAFQQRGNCGLVIRRIPAEVPTIEDMGLPEILKPLTTRSQGLILVTGPTGSGKSTTLAAMIDYINRNRKVHVMTLEDPIEFYHTDRMASINQRELGTDAPSFQDALRGMLRQDPDVILIGEMRDMETIQTAMTAAETGHLVMSTLHTNSAAASIDRIANTFPKSARPTVLAMLSSVLVGVVSQQLVRTTDGKRAAAMEIMVNSPSIARHIRAGNSQEITPIMEKSVVGERMQSMNQSLCALWASGMLDEESALAYSQSPDDLKQMYDKYFFIERYLDKSEEEVRVLDADSQLRLRFLRSLPKFTSRLEELAYFKRLSQDKESHNTASLSDVETQLKKLEQEREWVINQYNELRKRLERLKDEVERQEDVYKARVSKQDGEVKMLDRTLSRLKTQMESMRSGFKPTKKPGLFG